MKNIFLTLLIIICCVSCDKTNTRNMKQSPFFVHNVYFWTPTQDVEKNTNDLIEGLNMLKEIKVVKSFRVGVPAGTDREVVDNTYQVHLMVGFDSKEDQDIYQKAQIHLDFIEKYKHTWSKVQIYDSVTP